ncbi:efflux RND transporter periplasmic adaptor subunit [Methylocella tundrae]|uniref:Efflux transporter periplasmic adaptor subunit n=1 Tax=Methylocella tundrae TaxID=227605 RepID=A0A4U8Z3J7_METTU|nr:efflux RND transporter periplasmic adaptor subunit [Methylocella tundrae]WPP03840.1 efflux RND transporter periplasmic adaptor subunit [Methylocella tundrae]VFU10025.1 Efflux transporter periplasmic adaptor subunit [Methylocella tundrae]
MTFLRALPFRWSFAAALALAFPFALGLVRLDPAAAQQDLRRQEGDAGSESAGIRVSVAQAASACFSEGIHATGFLAPRSDAVVVLTQEGYAVAEILASEGDVVAEGQPLVRLDRVESPSPYAQAAAQQAAAQGQAAPPASIVLRAPAAGSIVASSARIGAIASPRAEPLFRLAVDGLIEAVAQVSSVYLAEIKEDQSARVQTDDGRDMTGRVRRIASEIDAATQMGQVRLALERDPALRVGRLIRATIDARHSCGVSIPRSALSYTSEGASVQVVRGRAIETVRVKVGLIAGGDAEIEAGLHSGDLVVANAGASLRDGDIVSPVLREDAGKATETP